MLFLTDCLSEFCRYITPIYYDSLVPDAFLKCYFRTRLHRSRVHLFSLMSRPDVFLAFRLIAYQWAQRYFNIYQHSIHKWRHSMLDIFVEHLLVVLLYTPRTTDNGKFYFSSFYFPNLCFKNWHFFLFAWVSNKNHSVTEFFFISQLFI